VPVRMNSAALNETRDRGGDSGGSKPREQRDVMDDLVDRLAALEGSGGLS